VSTNLPGGRRSFTRASTTCPVGGCPHALVLHDVDEIPWPRIERCTVQDCGCSGLVESRVAA
jgi:hypothetical protein